MLQQTVNSAPTLRSKLAAGQFVLTAEVAPPLSGAAAARLAPARPPRGLAAAVNATAGAR
jgi:hypothetical protein